jgi:pyrimidine-specific ribonucleoside hydrolase
LATPVISITDLYHPPEDPGDNFDIVMPFGNERVDLRGVVLDAEIEKREDIARGVEGYPGPRDPGIIPMSQLNAIFGTAVPFGISPFARMRSLTDRMDDVPRFQQTGIDLLLRLLEESSEPIHLMSFGSARAIAVAFNRNPELMREKVARVHLSAGSTTLDYLEWNVYLDPLAARRVVDSGLPISLYPCASAVDCFSYDRHNTYWKLDTLEWIKQMHPALRRFMLYGLGRSERVDFLRALDDEPSDELKRAVYSREHSVWETAPWMIASGSSLVQHPAGDFEIVAERDVRQNDRIIGNRQVACSVTTHESGLYSFELTGQNAATAPVTIFERDDTAEYERALRQALPRLYTSFVPEGWQGDTIGSYRDPAPTVYAGPIT